MVAIRINEMTLTVFIFHKMSYNDGPALHVVMLSCHYQRGGAVPLPEASFFFCVVASFDQSLFSVPAFYVSPWTPLSCNCWYEPFICLPVEDNLYIIKTDYQRNK